MAWLEIRLNVFHCSTIPQKLFIAIIIIMIIVIIKRTKLEQKSGLVNGHEFFIIKCHKHYTDILKIATKRKNTIRLKTSFMNYYPRDGKMGDTDPPLICHVNQSNEYYITLIQIYSEIMSQHCIR